MIVCIHSFTFILDGRFRANMFRDTRFVCFYYLGERGIFMARSKYVGDERKLHLMGVCGLEN